ncbi:hypothetical protein [Acinetobacter lwoffii]|uniref:hypothetical protein n=1 Tax=Acinetobacter lwoffii TaxID=28090 RepID=UPI003F8F71BA
MISKQLGIKLSALTLALILAGCGGGGSDGYYNNGGSNSGNAGGSDSGIGNPSEAVETNYHLIINVNKPRLVVTGDSAVVTVKLVDVNGGGVASEAVQLAIEDTQKNGVTIEGPSQLTTDQNGNAIFNLILSPSNISSLNELLAKGIRINSSFKDGTGKVISQTTLLGATESSSEAELGQYHLAIITNKPTLVATGDNALITVKAIDANGGGVADKDVSLSVIDTKLNKVTIVGSSVQKTDAEGNVSFTVVLPRTEPNESLIASGITLNASVIDANNNISSQLIKLNVAKGVVEQPIGNITFGKSSELEKSADALYYREALSAHVVDINGNPLPNYKVTMNIDLLRAGSGVFTTKARLQDLRTQRLTPVRNQLLQQNANLQQQEAVLTNIQNAPIQSSAISNLENNIRTTQQSIRSARISLADANTTLALAQNAEDDGRIKAAQASIATIQGRINILNIQLEELNDDLSREISAENNAKQQRVNSQQAIVNQFKNQVQQTQDRISNVEKLELPARLQSYCELSNKSNIQLATGFVDPTGNITPSFTYTTDATGKFNFSVQYLRQYAGWQTVEFRAQTNVSTKDINSSFVYTLGLLKDDFDAETGQPFDSSPYGNNCVQADPFAPLL